VKFDALFYLLSDAFRGLTIGGCEGLVVAKSATSKTHFSVTIWTGKTGIYRHLLNTLAKVSAKVCRVTVVAPVVTPRISHLRNFLQK
jgi:hypothetical protein